MTDKARVFDVDVKKCEEIVRIKMDYVAGRLSFDEARRELKSKFDYVTPEEFAYGEQKLKEEGMADEEMHDRMNDIIRLFDGILRQPALEALPEGHPVRTFMAENAVMEKIVGHMKALLAKDKFIKNEWLEVYDKLLLYQRHFARKHNQLFPFLEQKGFDRPTAIMWSFDDAVRNVIGKGKKLLDKDDEKAFRELQPEVIEKIEDIMLKERTILYPTSLKLLTEQEFRQMRIGEEEIGFANIDEPQGFLPETKQDEAAPAKVMAEGPTEGFADEFNALLQKYKIGKTAEEILDVANGRLTLEQINLIYRHLPMDLTFTDENDIVKFYTDTKERVFDRSAGIIGRLLQNCHPREVWPIVNRVVSSLRSGEKDKVQFTLKKKGRIVHIEYIGVHDEAGNFRGVLETMQDVTPFAKDGESIAAEQRKEAASPVTTPTAAAPAETKPSAGVDDLTTSITMAGLFDKYPYLKDFFVELSPVYQKLKNPVIFAAMGRLADLGMAARRGGFEPDELLEKVKAEIRKHEKK